MSNETVVETPVVETAQEPVVEVSPVETQAREQGWVSKEEWVEAGKSADDWRPAKEFVDRGELYRSIHSTKRELKQTQAALTALQRHHQYVFEKAHQQALKDLKNERRMALREGDPDYVEAVEGKIDELQEQYARDRAALAREQQAANTAPQKEFEEFTSRNPWYVSDEELREQADAFGYIYLNKPNTDKSPEAVFKHVEKKIREKFPEKFGIKKAAPNPTAAVDRTTRQTKGSDIQLDEFEQEIMRTLVRSGEMTEAQYKAELKRAKGIK